MCTVAQMLDRVESIRDEIISIAGNAMMANKDELIALLVYQQFEQNVDSEGNPLRQYTYLYAKEKRELTGRGNKTDFDLTGEFHANMNMAIDGDIYSFNSTATTQNGILKSEWLKEWQGAEIMDYTDENKKQAWLIIKPEFVEQVNAYLNGNR